MQFPDARILVFCKAPVPGQVKTRLAQTIGDVRAAQLHETLARRILLTLTEARVAPLQLWCAPDANHPFFHDCRDIFGVELHEQAGADLGAKMSLAFDFALRGARHAVVVGTDCPAIDGVYVREALHKLHGGADGVIGPAEDGGYVMLGLNKPTPSLFEGIAWGTHEVLTQTRTKMTGHWHELPMLWDVDRPEDLERLEKSGMTMCRD